jgi:threonine/homoserine/homoserine lactone efflux protein
MSYVLPLAGLAFANFLGIISPGPAFMMVSRAAAGHSKGAAVALGMGVAIAAAIWAAAACFGVSILMSRFAPVYGAIQLAGGAFLIWLGIGAWRSGNDKPQDNEAADLVHAGQQRGIARSVLVGAMLSLGNPKIVIFFSSIFVALLPAHAPLWVRLAVIVIVGLQETLWYTVVAFIFSRPRVQAAYRRARNWIERTLGAVLIGIGVRIIATVKI